MIEELILSQP